MIHEMAKRKRSAVTDGTCEQHRIDAGAVKRSQSNLSAQISLDRVAEEFKVLGHATRLKVLEALDGGELCVCDLSQILELSMSGTSQQLRELRRLGAVNYRVLGKFAYYFLADRSWLELVRTMIRRLDSAGVSAKGMRQAV